VATITAKDKLATLIDELAVNLKNNHNVTLTQAQLTDTKRVSAEWLDNTQTKVVALAANKPDYNQLILQLQNMLEHEDAWRDTITAGGGQAILRLISTAVAFAVFASERTTQERYPGSAQLPSSIYAYARGQGVRVTRRRPPKVPVSLVRSDSEYLLIPEFTLFTVGTTKFFNRTAIVFGKGELFPVEAELVQGEIFIDSYKSPGRPFAMYEVGNGDGTISEEDVYLYVDGEQYTRITEKPYMYGANDKVFYENTLQNGNVEVLTGSGNYGVMPPSNADLRIRYATTLGVEAHNATVEIPVLCPDFPTVSGLTVSPIAGGGSPETVDFYRINAPAIRAKSGRLASTRREYEVDALKYKPLKIYDARVIGQKEFAPNNKAYMGVLKVAALTDFPMDDAQWVLFSKYLSGIGWEGFEFLREDPLPIPIDISVEIGINLDYGLEATRLAARSILTNAYAPKQGVLGLEFRRHDIESVIIKSEDKALKGGINWVDVISPEVSTIPAVWNGYFTINSLNVVTKYATRANTNRLA
jgi:hypothetical protein